MGYIVFEPLTCLLDSLILVPNSNPAMAALSPSGALLFKFESHRLELRYTARAALPEFCSRSFLSADN